MARPKPRERMYVIARGASDRPTCQHLLLVLGQGRYMAACGASIERWSVEFTPHRFETILCKRSRCRE